MGVTLERVQNKFACIIGELCNEPAVLSQFAVWVDLRIAEYKAKGAISLDCTGSTPDPIWLHGLKPPKSDQSVSSLDHVSAESSSRNFQRSEPSNNFLSHNNDNFEVVEIKEESPDIFPTPTLVPSERLVGTAGSFSRKRSASDIETQDFLNSDNSIFSSPLKSRRLSTSKCIADVTTKTETEDSVSNQSLMSVIGIQDEPEELHVASSNSGHIHTSHSEYEYAKGNPPENTDDDSVQIDTSVGLVGSGLWTQYGGNSEESSEGSRWRRREKPSNNSTQLTCHTLQNTRLAIARFEEWLLAHSGDTRSIELIPPEELDPYLAEFFMNVRRKEGGEYTRRSLESLRERIQRHLRMHGYKVNISRSEHFANSKQAFRKKVAMLLEADKA